MIPLTAVMTGPKHLPLGFVSCVNQPASGCAPLANRCCAVVARSAAAIAGTAAPQV